MAVYSVITPEGMCRNFMERFGREAARAAECLRLTAAGFKKEFGLIG